MNTEQAIPKIEWFKNMAIKMNLGDRALESLDMALSTLRAQAERENPKPLTVEELREREGKPVYCVDGAGNKAWAVVNASAEDCIDNESGAWIFSYYALHGTDGLYGLDKQLGWLAYAHEPKEARG